MFLATLAAAAILTSARPALQAPEGDYQASIVRGSGALVVVFERLNLQTLIGDLWAMRSFDGGATWSAPLTVAATPANERAPSLLFDGSGYILFYLGETSPAAYRIFRASSPDGAAWTLHGPIDLGWPSGGEINPDVIREADGSLTMTYHRLGGRSYIARSQDGGATWDTKRTEITPTSSALPRIAKRESDGTYLVTYQVNPGNNALQLFAKTTRSVYDWTAPAMPLSTAGNSHDSAPHVLADGTFAVAYAEQSDADSFSLRYRVSADGAAWSAPLTVTDDPASDDVQPHWLDVNDRLLLLIWSRNLDLWTGTVALAPAARRRSIGR